MIYGSYDNRSNLPHPEKTSIIKRLHAAARGRRLPLYHGGGLHVRTPPQGKRIVYTYIRKNGCSAFKKWLRDSGGYKTGKNEITAMRDHFGLSFEYEAARSDFLLVLRDPGNRLASLFRNKLIQRSYADDILENIRSLTGIDPDVLTFRTFVETYIAQNISGKQKTALGLDVHAIPQHTHLWPVVYNKVVMLPDLPAAAENLFPKSVAQHYFCRKRNSSSDSLTDSSANDISVRDLRNDFLSTGMLPSDAALFDDILQSSVETLYEMDYNLIKASFGSTNA